MTVTDDSIISRQLDWDLTPRVDARNYIQATAIDSLLELGGRLYLFTHLKKGDPAKKIVSYWVPHKRYGNLFIMKADTLGYAEPVKSGFGIKADTSEIVFPLFLSKTEMGRLRLLKSIQEMSVEDFRKYFNLNLQMRELIASERETGAAGDILYYGYFMGRYIFSEIGYSPLFTSEQLEDMFRKFSVNPDTKELVEQLLEID